MERNSREEKRLLEQSKLRRKKKFLEKNRFLRSQFQRRKKLLEEPQSPVGKHRLKMRKYSPKYLNKIVLIPNDRAIYI